MVNIDIFNHLIPKYSQFLFVCVFTVIGCSHDGWKMVFYPIVLFSPLNILHHWFKEENSCQTGKNNYVNFGFVNISKLNARQMRCLVGIGACCQSLSPEFDSG